MVPTSSTDFERSMPADEWCANETLALESSATNDVTARNRFIEFSGVAP
jgi:hypothetical protein